MEDKKNLIETVLKGEEIAFEPVPDEQDSPLAHPVVNRNQPVSEGNGESNSGETSASQQQAREKPTDAPEQKIDEEPKADPKASSESDEEEFSIPIEHAGMMADSILGTVNNTLLEVGGGFFVTIRKHKDFYDFEEVIQVIDEQNVKNIKRLKLDEEDKALIRPLLIYILRKKSAALSPEMQLLMVTLSILVKKTKAVIEIRAENEILVERIRDIIRKEMAAYHGDRKQDPAFDAHQGSEGTEGLYDDTDDFSASGSTTGLPDEAVEIVD
jgi:hypothetical protein